MRELDNNKLGFRGVSVIADALTKLNSLKISNQLVMQLETESTKVVPSS